MQVHRTVRWAVLVCVWAGCGPKPGGPGDGGTRQVLLHVGALAEASAVSTQQGLASRKQGIGAPTADLALVSATAFSFAHLDGLRLRTEDVRVLKDDRPLQAADWYAEPLTLEISSNTNEVAIDSTLTLDLGDYTGASISFDGSFDVKAFCRTATKLVYTTATGVKAVECTGCATAVPSDYDYFHYPFAYLSTAESPTSTQDKVHESTNAPFTIEDGVDATLSLLIDPSFVVSCYDGTVALGEVGQQTPGVLSPFGWNPRSGVITDYYPSGAPAFGLAYLPLFISVQSASDTSQPVGETYVASADQANVDAAAPDFSSLLITTVAFRADDSILAMRSRNFDVAHQTGLYQLYGAFQSPAAGTYDMANGEWYRDPDLHLGRVVEDRIVQEFVRQPDSATSFATPIVDGPDCGATLMGDYGNVARPCGPNPATVYWRRVAR